MIGRLFFGDTTYELLVLFRLLCRTRVATSMWLLSDDVGAVLSSLACILRQEGVIAGFI